MRQAKKFLDFTITNIVQSKDASGECIIEGYANTSTKDRVGDVVLPEAFKSSLPTYLGNPILLENHNWDKVAGVTQTAEITDKGLFIRAKVSDTRPDLKQQIREGCLRTFSIGYNELDSDYDDATKTKYVKNLELLEISIVSVPANPEAKFQEVSGNNSQSAPKENTSEASAAESRQGTPAAGESAEAAAKPADSAKYLEFLSFIESVKKAYGVDELDNETATALCECFNTKNEEFMKVKELIEKLRQKAVPAATQAGTKADGGAPADSSKPAGSPAASENAKPAEGAAGDDAGKKLDAVLEKLNQIADALAQLLEAEQAEQDAAAPSAAEGDAEGKDAMKCDKCSEKMEPQADGKTLKCKNGHEAPAPAAKPADGAAPADDQKSVQELESTISELEAEIAKLQS